MLPLARIEVTRGLTRKCSRQAGVGQSSVRARPSRSQTVEALVGAGAEMIACS
jgi:hypothetical protein